MFKLIQERRGNDVIENTKTQHQTPNKYGVAHNLLYLYLLCRRTCIDQMNQQRSVIDAVNLPRPLVHGLGFPITPLG